MVVVVVGVVIGDSGGHGSDNWMPVVAAVLLLLHVPQGGDMIRH